MKKWKPVTETPAERVAKGAAWLDKNQPDWVVALIYNGKRNGFDLGDPNICILGNVFADMVEYDSWMDGYDYGAVKRLKNKNVDEFGFNISCPNNYDDAGEECENSHKAEWQGLAEAWQNEVLKRTTCLPALETTVVKIFKPKPKRKR